MITTNFWPRNRENVKYVKILEQQTTLDADTFSAHLSAYGSKLILGKQCKKLKIPITTFMIASDPYLQKFVQEFTEMNNGKAFFASLDKLGAFIFKDFESGKRKTVY